MNLSSLTVRQLQLESARALSVLNATNFNLSQFNKKAHHNSHEWYKTIILWYVEKYGDLPSKIGPGKDIKLIHDV